MVLGSFQVENTAAPRSAIRATTVSKVVESAHNYANNFDYTWTIHQSGASKIRLRIYVDVETNYDYLYLMDGSGSVVTTYTGNPGWHWTAWVNDDTVKLRLKTDYSVTKYGFRTYKYEYEAGAPPVDDGGLLTDGVAATGHMNSADGSDMYWINVGANAESMRVVLSCGSADFDTYGKAGSQPTTSSYDWRGYTSGGEDNTVSNPAQGWYYIMVDYYSGDADYTLTATITYAAADTTAPSVSISNPSNGATVSGTTTISFSASDANGISSRQIKIDGVLKSTSSSYSWDTTAYSNGAHTIVCTATDPSGNTGSDTHTVTVSNSAPVDDGGALTDGVAASGHMDQADGSDMYWIDVEANALSMRVVLAQSSGDFDTFGRFNAYPTTSTYDWRGYTSGGEDNTVNSPQEGRHYIMVDYYSGDADYTLTVTITYGGGGGGSWGTGGKYAIIVGISDYQSISDLSYCDEDATDWYNFLNGQGYECHVYGDGHTSNFPRYDGTAYESTVRAAVQELANHAQAGDEVFFITSGHGSGDGNGNSYLCMYDCSGSAGCYTDDELAADISGFNLDVNIMVFIDHCYSGGMGPELMSLSQKIYCTTTCTEDGYGYDEPSHQNGAWTYEYLEKYWVGSPSTSAESIYDQASASYPHSGGDACMEFDGFPGSFYV
jgi:hypothetical protein